MDDVTLALPAGTVLLRRATHDDLTAILELLADDPISASRGDAARPEDRPEYERAFRQIDRDPAQQLLVATSPTGEVLATMQLTLIPGLARVGASRLRCAMDAAPGLGAQLVQLTSDAARVDAHRFYERLGFTASHVGFKYNVPPRATQP